MSDVFLVRFGNNYNIVYVHIAHLSDFLSNDVINCPLKYASGIFKTKSDSGKFMLLVVEIW